MQHPASLMWNCSNTVTIEVPIIYTLKLCFQNAQRFHHIEKGKQCRGPLWLKISRRKKAGVLEACVYDSPKNNIVSLDRPHRFEYRSRKRKWTPGCAPLPLTRKITKRTARSPVKQLRAPRHRNYRKRKRISRTQLPVTVTSTERSIQ